MKRIYLIRHCQAQGQEPAAPLTKKGLEQADGLAEFFANRPVEMILSSPYERAVSSVMPLSRKFGLDIQRDDRLRERVLAAEHRADWLEKLEETFHNLDMKLPGGESSREAMIRGSAVIRELLHRPEQNIAVATHGNLLVLLLKVFDDTYDFHSWRKLTNPDVFELHGSEKNIKIKRIWQS